MTSAEFGMHEATVAGRGAKLETAGWGLFFIWVGVCLLAGFGWGIFCFGTGVLMLGSQAFRHRIGLALDRFGLALGTCFAVGGGILAMGWRVDEITMPTWLVPALFIGVGAAFVVSAWRRRPNA